MADVPERLWIDREHGRHPEDWTWTSDEVARESHPKRRMETDMVQFVRVDLYDEAVRALDAFVRASRRTLEVHSGAKDECPLTRILDLSIGDLRLARDVVERARGSGRSARRKPVS